MENIQESPWEGWCPRQHLDNIPGLPSTIGDLDFMDVLCSFHDLNPAIEYDNCVCPQLPELKAGSATGFHHSANGRSSTESADVTVDSFPDEHMFFSDENGNITSTPWANDKKDEMPVQCYHLCDCVLTTPTHSVMQNSNGRQKESPSTSYKILLPKMEHNTERSLESKLSSYCSVIANRPSRATSKESGHDYINLRPLLSHQPKLHSGISSPALPNTSVYSIRDWSARKMKNLKERARRKEISLQVDKLAGLLPISIKDKHATSDVLDLAQEYIKLLEKLLLTLEEEKDKEQRLNLLLSTRAKAFHAQIT